MMSLVSSVVMFSLVSGGVSFILNFSHLLNILLSLEFLALSVYWWLSIMVFNMSSDFFFVLFFLVMVVSEGVLGLSLLIMSVYSHGSDKMKSYSSLLC
nr:TPA_asm: ND4L [Echinogammarus veneris]